MRGYHASGKEVRHHGKHVADACDNYTATMIADALNLLASNDDPEFEPVAFVAKGNSGPAVQGHMIRREGDEYVCVTCGIRWGFDEGSDHP